MASLKTKASEPKGSLRRWEEATDEDLYDPEKLLACPFDPNHQIRSCRFPYHLIKCRRNHPELAKQLWTCPFNARHLMPRHELFSHMSNCVNRCSVNSEAVQSFEIQRKFHIPVNTWTMPECDEDWDQEEEAAAPFVRGLSTSQPSQERTEQVATKCFTSSLRAPRVPAWKLDK